MNQNVLWWQRSVLKHSQAKSIVNIESKTLLRIKWGIHIKRVHQSIKVFSEMHKAYEGFVWYKLIYMILKEDNLINIGK